MNYLEVNFTPDKLKGISSLALAHVGDAVYELMVRTYIASRDGGTARNMHFSTVKMVAAPAQAKFAKRILEILTPEEADVFRRGRNAKVNSVPKASSVEDYHTATALEALFGYLYLTGEKERLSELFGIMMEEK